MLIEICNKFCFQIFQIFALNWVKKRKLSKKQTSFLSWTIWLNRKLNGLQKHVLWVKCPIEKPFESSFQNWKIFKSSIWKLNNISLSKCKIYWCSWQFIAFYFFIFLFFYFSFPYFHLFILIWQLFCYVWICLH